MNDTPPPVVVFVEHVLWTPREEWQAAIAHLESRFARATPLDGAAVLEAGPLHAQIAYMQAWAAVASVDLGRELGRWLDEHLAMHVRPAPAVTRAVRALATTHEVHAASTLPAAAAESIARHAGCFRSFTALHDGIATAQDLDDLVGRLTPEQVFAAPPTPLPERVSAIPLPT